MTILIRQLRDHCRAGFTRHGVVIGTFRFSQTNWTVIGLNFCGKSRLPGHKSVYST